MSVEPNEYWLDNILDESIEQAIDAFELERLQSFYETNQNIAYPASQALSAAKTLIQNHPSAAHIFAVIAIEVGLKDVLIIPLLSGLIFNQSFAEKIAALIIQNKSLKDVRPFLKLILEHPKIIDKYNSSKLNLDKFKRPGINKTYWEELTEIYKIRNHILHKGAEVDKTTAQHAIEVASFFFKDLLHTVLTELGFSVDDDWKIK